MQVLLCMCSCTVTFNLPLLVERRAPSTLCRLGAGGRAGEEQVRSGPSLHAIRGAWGKHVPPVWTPRSRPSSPSPWARPPGGMSSSCWGPVGEAGGPRAGMEGGWVWLRRLRWMRTRVMVFGAQSRESILVSVDPAVWIHLLTVIYL